jgi:hypothetical protein
MMLGGNTDVAPLVEKYIPANSLGAEIGVWKGASSKIFLKKARHLHMVDPWNIGVYERSTDWNNIGFEGILKRYSRIVGSEDPKDFQIFYDNLYGSICEEFKALPVTIHRMTSTKWFKSYRDERLDWIYIDGDHSYEGVISDLNQCLSVVKPHGIIFLDDVAKDNSNHLGVRRAIGDFCKKNKLTAERVLYNQCMIQL